MKLQIKAFALTGGITWGLIILLTTFWFLVMGYEGATLAKLGKSTSDTLLHGSVLSSVSHGVS